MSTGKYTAKQISENKEFQANLIISWLDLQYVLICLHKVFDTVPVTFL